MQQGMTEEDIEAIEKDPSKAPLEDNERAMLAFVIKAIKAPDTIAKDGSGLPYSLAVARVRPGERTLPHLLTDETEVYYIVSGRGRMRVGAEESELGPGDAVVIPAGSEQWIECSGDEPLQFVALVSPPWRADHDQRVH